VSTQSSVWDEIQARRAEASPGTGRDAVSAPEPAVERPAPAVERSTPSWEPAASPAEPSTPASEPSAEAAEPSAPASEPSAEAAQLLNPAWESAIATEPPAVDVEPEAFLVPSPEGWTDSLTGTEGPRFFERMIAKEEARRRRYNRGASVALVDLTGFEGGRDWYGRELATQFFARIGRALAKEVRTSDHIARIGPVRFGIVLLETDEIGAINFIDRVRATCGKEFWAGSGLGLRTGWASAAEAGGLGSAVVLAQRRLGDPAFQEAQLRSS
jgi:GGDEF domain-containing protein